MAFWELCSKEAFFLCSVQILRSAGWEWEGSSTTQSQPGTSSARCWSVDRGTGSACSRSAGRPGRGHGGQGHGVMLHGVAHVLRVQVLALVRHDLRGLLAVQHREVRGHVDIDVIHGPFWQAAVGLGPRRWSSGPRVGAGAGAGSRARLARGGAPGGAGTWDHGDRLHQAGARRGSALLGLLLGPQASAAASCHQ